MSDYTYLNTDGMYRYLKSEMDQNRMHAWPCTGFRDLDRIQPLYPGFYCLGAAPGMGKTIFLLQVADQIAEQHIPVLYFSVKQYPHELYAKSLSRMSWQLDAKQALTAMDIRTGRTNPETINHLRDIYSGKTGNLVHIAGPYKCIDMRLIKETIRAFRKEVQGVHDPAIIIDGLADFDPSYTSSHDRTIRELGKLQRERHLTLLLSCPLIPERYNPNLLMEIASFENGASIAANADVIWALQPYRYSSISETLEVNDRPVRLDFLKNAFGPVGRANCFTYHAAYNMFVEE